MSYHSQGSCNLCAERCVPTWHGQIEGVLHGVLLATLYLALVLRDPFGGIGIFVLHLSCGECLTNVLLSSRLQLRCICVLEGASTRHCRPPVAVCLLSLEFLGGGPCGWVLKAVRYSRWLWKSVLCGYCRLRPRTMATNCVRAGMDILARSLDERCIGMVYGDGVP